MIQRLTDEELKSLIEAYNAEKDRVNIPVAGTTLSGELVPMVPDNISIGSGMGP